MLKSSGLDNTNPILNWKYLHLNVSALPKSVHINHYLPLCFRLKYSNILTSLTDVKSSTKDIQGIQLELNYHPGLGICLNRPQSCGCMGENNHQLGTVPK